MIIKNKKHLYIFLILILIWRCIIFVFSAQPGDESTDTSIGFGAKIVGFFIPEFREMSKEEQREFLEPYDFIIRKSAHFCEYAVMGMLSMLLLQQIYMKMKWKIFCSIGISAFMACTDEFHQLFVEGRAGRIQDVCIDTSGAALGILVTVIGITVIEKICQRKTRIKKNLL
ncbi:MAG: VanZ family protein [Bariatricus sp.]|nr:VanZ family protein [Bariatricus sp.]